MNEIRNSQTHLRFSQDHTGKPVVVHNFENNEQYGDDDFNAGF